VFVIRCLLSCSIFLLGSFSSFAQTKGYNKSELKELAIEAENLQDYESAAIYYEAYLNKKPNDFRLKYRLAENYRLMGETSKAKGLYYALMTNYQKKFPLAEYHYAQMLKSQDSCQLAIPIFESFRKNYRGEKEERKYRRIAKFNIEGCQQVKDSSQSALMIKPLGQAVNTNRMQGAPIFLNNETLVFNSLPKETAVEFSMNEETPFRTFYKARLNKGLWTFENRWEEMNIANGQNVVNGAFNSNKSRFYYTVCVETIQGKENCDIYYKNKIDDSWSNAIKLNEEINTKYIETQPAVGIDEKGRETLYFVSDRKEGKGGLDIWYSTYDEKRKTFKTPRNCGSKVNSVGDEITPFISTMNGKLYFSSNGHPGYGGFDVFKSSGQRSRWQEPENIGAMINGSHDETYYVVNESGDAGVFASNRPYKEKQAIQACCDDLFEFKKLENLAIQVNANLVNEETDEKIKKATLAIYSRDEDGTLYFNRNVNTDEDGKLSFFVEGGEDYVLKFQADNYLNETRIIKASKHIQDNEIKLRVPLKEKENKTYQLENIYYEFGDDQLTEKAYESIDTTILKILIENPEIVVEIGSHTDSRGTEGFNKSLSQKRAESVVKYLRKKGIAKERLQAKGYGESQPVAPNTFEDGSDNPEGRAKNRRTEFKVIGKIELAEEEDDD